MKRPNKNISQHYISTFLMGSEDINVITAIRSFGRTNWPFGLLMSEQTLSKGRGNGPQFILRMQFTEEKQRGICNFEVFYN